MLRLGGLLALAGFLLVSAASSAVPTADSSGPQSPFSSQALLGHGNGQMLLRADRVDYDVNTGVSTAVGNVEIDYNGRILLADRVVYDKDNDKVTASGHVVIMAPSGDVVFAQEARLTDAMKNGAMESFAALIGANGRLVAARARRVGGVETLATRAVYTPCKICDKPGQRTPVWAVKASHVTYDEIRHRIYYRDAVVEMEGVPILYTPFFSHPDPTVKHASGILMPEPSTRTTLGYYVRLPIYAAFSDSQDMTIAPLVSTFGGEQLETEYRQRWDNGGMWLQASVADDPHAGSTENVSQVYSSLFGAGIVPFNDVWHLGYQAQLTSYASYLQRYGISSLDRLNNDLFIEGMDGRSRFAITGYFFQGLRTTDDNNLFPVVLPLVEYTYIPRAPVLGGDFRFDVETISIARNLGEDDQRLTGELLWRLPFVTDDGQLITFQAYARGDVYHTNNVNALGETGLPDSQYLTRGAPYVALDWRWPFVSPGAWGMTGFVVEPIAQLIAAPYGDNPAGLPNETGYGVVPTSSLTANFQLDSTNIFNLNRLSSYDYVDSGPSANVGVRSQALFPTGSVEFILGQAYRLKPNPIFAPDSGYDGTISDVVGGLNVNFQPHLSISDRIDIDSSSGTLERNEAAVNAVFGRSSVQIGYLKLPSEEVTLGLGAREEIKAQALIGLWGNWEAFLVGQRDLEASQMISDEFGFGYDDECFGFSLAYERNFTEFRELPPSTSVLFYFTFKTTEVPVQRAGIFPERLYPVTPL